MGRSTNGMSSLIRSQSAADNLLVLRVDQVANLIAPGTKAHRSLSFQ